MTVRLGKYRLKSEYEGEGFVIVYSPSGRRSRIPYEALPEWRRYFAKEENRLTTPKLATAS
jgi:hypothetical protein